MTPLIRPDLASVDPYRAPQVEAPVRLNTNESPYPMPKGFAEELSHAVGRIPFHRYPDRDAAILRKGLAEHVDHPAAGVWVANGSNEVIQQLCLAYGGSGRRALVFEPTYALHTLIPAVVGMEVVSERLDDRFRLGPRVGEVVAGHAPDVVFVCSPNNPTGNGQGVEAVEALCRGAGEALVVVDEAYVEFGGRSVAPLLHHFPNLVVVRTFSKAFAMAAARIGYCLTDPAIVEDLARVRLPYHLSALAQVAGEVALRHAAEALEVLERIRGERDRLVKRLDRLSGVEVFPSDANFVLFRTTVSAPKLWRALLDRGVLVRDVSSAPGLERCLRVTAGTSEETEAFLTALPEAMGTAG